jgi:hypothetical protein
MNELLWSLFIILPLQWFLIYNSYQFGVSSSDIIRYLIQFYKIIPNPIYRELSREVLILNLSPESDIPISMDIIQAFPYLEIKKDIRCILYFHLMDSS